MAADKTITIRLDKEAHKSVKQLALDTNVSITVLVKEAIELYREKHIH